MRRWTAVVVLGLVLSGCSGAPEPDARSTPTGATTQVRPDPDPATPTGSPSAVPDPVSLPALGARPLDGGALRLGREVSRTSSQRQYHVTYHSGGLTISGRLAVPVGDGPFPAVVLAHGYIDPAVYVNGQGLTREREWLADHGYLALHVDYRGHAESSPDRSRGLDMRMGYTEDVLNAVVALRAWRGPVDDDRIALLGRSMGGGVVLNAITAKPGLVKAAVVYASVSSDAVENFDRWIRDDPGRRTLADLVVARHGDPADDPAFWRGISARTYFGDVTEPVLVHHGTADDTCPPRWSRTTVRLLRASGADATLLTYPGEGHAFGPAMEASLAQTDAFLRRHLSGGQP